jgi:hypothetical protein
LPTDGTFGLGPLELVLEFAETGFEFADAGFELGNHDPANRALGQRVVGWGWHTMNMTKSNRKSKPVSMR